MHRNIMDLIELKSYIKYLLSLVNMMGSEGCSRFRIVIPIAASDNRKASRWIII